MKGSLYRRTCWLVLVAMLSGGFLLQTTTTSCGSVAIQAVAGLTSSVVSTFVYSSLAEGLGLPPISYGSGLAAGLTGTTGLLGT